MKQKRIALIGYPPYFFTFSQALEQIGFEVFWVASRRSTARYLTNVLGVPAARVLDSTKDFNPAAGDIDECRAHLAELEATGGPRIYDITLMDRILRRKSQSFALRYLDHLQKRVKSFLASNSISLVSSGRDTALQIVTMLVCRQLETPWVVPNRLRIPQEMYGFCRGHETADMVRFRSVTAEDRAWAAAFQSEFSEKAIRPAAKKAVRSFVDVLRLLPEHAAVFWEELKNALPDRGNDYSRYTFPQLIGMYARRRVNLLGYTLFPPYSAPGDGPFCLYALHTQPESSIDVAGSYFSDQIALITFIARSLPASHELYVKVHPTDVDGKPLSFYRRISQIPGVRLIDFAIDSRELVRRASIVFSLTGTISYEAGLMGKTVVTFARNYFNVLPTIHYCDSPPRLPLLIDSLLDTDPPPDLKERTRAFLAEMRACCFDGEVNRMYGTTTEDLSTSDLKNLQMAYESLYGVLVLGTTTEGTVTR